MSLTVWTVPFAPHAAYAELIFPEKTGCPGQCTLTSRSRGKDIIETVFVAGSVRISITVSDREGVFAASLARWS